jgi:hypothetical protein
MDGIIRAEEIGTADKLRYCIEKKIKNILVYCWICVG